MGAALDDMATDREIDREHKRVAAAISEARKEGMEWAARGADEMAMSQSSPQRREAMHAVAAGIRAEIEYTDREP